MSSKVQIRRGSGSSASSFLGAEGELYANTDLNDLRLHDGVTVGGHRIPNESFVNEVADGKVDKLPTSLTPGSVGGNNSIPILTYNAQGQIVAVSAATVFIPNLTSQLMNDAGFISSNNLAYVHSVSEKLNTKTNATGTVVHNMSDGAIWYHTNIASNFTVNLTNVYPTSNQSIGIALILVQSSSPYIPSALQIDGVAQTIKWQDSTAPVGNANKTDIINFTLIRLSSSWVVLGSLSTYG